MCVMVPAEVVRAALEMPISRELWALIDREQRKDLGAEAVPVYVVPPLSPEIQRAADAADAARRQIDARLKALHEHPAPRALFCGKLWTIHLRRVLDGGAVEDGLIRPCCGRSDCPHCWRRRLSRVYARLTACLLDDPERGDDGTIKRRLPRLGSVHVAEVSWPEWPALDRSIRRQHGGDCGRLRLRRFDNRVLVVCGEPFRGSRALPPAEACLLLAEAVEELHPERNSYRQNGSWYDRQPARWHQVQRFLSAIDLDGVAGTLAELGQKARRLRSPNLQGLFWRSVDAASADATAAGIGLSSDPARPSSAKEEHCSSRRYSGAPPGAAQGLEGRGERGEEFDPGATPWG